MIKISMIKISMTKNINGSLITAATALITGGMGLLEQGHSRDGYVAMAFGVLLFIVREWRKRNGE